jgi:hypothetical protein
MGNNGLAYMIGGYVKSTQICVDDPFIREWGCEEENIPSRIHHAQCLVIGDEIWAPTAWGAKSE